MNVAMALPGDDPRFGPWGKQKCEDTGPLNKKRMETIDEEFLKATTEFIDGAVRDRKPFFIWFNPTRMHIWTHLKPSSQEKTGLGIYPDGMVEHDGQVGELLKKLDDLGIANNTIVIYTTDNGAEAFSWPDGGTTPFRGLGVTETVAQQAHRDGGGGREWRTAHAEQRWGRMKYAGVPNHDRPAMLIRRWSAGRRHLRRRWRAGSPAPSRWRSH
jgi:arylsulfatase A-like enzyme